MKIMSTSSPRCARAAKYHCPGRLCAHRQYPRITQPAKLADVLERGYVETESTQAGDVPNAPEIPKMLASVRPIQEFVRVDAHIPGCPPDADAIWYALTELLAGRQPKWTPANMRYD